MILVYLVIVLIIKCNAYLKYLCDYYGDADTYHYQQGPHNLTNEPNDIISMKII